MPEDLDLPSDIRDLLNADWDTSPSNGHGLVSDPDSGGVSAESLDAYLANLRKPILSPLATTGGGIVEGTVPTAETLPPESEPEDDEEAPEPPPAADISTSPVEPPPLDSPETVDINGRAWTREQLEAFARFSDSLDSDPALQSLLTSYYTGRLDALQGQQTGASAPAAYVPPAQAPAPAAPEFDEADDPRLILLANQLRQQQAQIQQLTQATQATAEQQIVRSAQEAESLMTRAAKSFQEQHALEDTDIVRLRQTAARMRVLEPLMSGIDPITGAPSRPDILSATERALEIALFADPAFRQREIDKAMAVTRDRNRKRQKLAGVGGSGGSVSRTPASAAPGTAQSKQQMTAEVAEMMAGTWNPR
ncbi:MAG TPA: hypothetical protein VNV87_04485 [Acidimicrobiales bacterium]|jgi:hypothetical protein|nr:hypothetical protein [Acidimicrobiales bacterium]